MADYKIPIPFIRHWEGGFSNHPADRGGATNKGVTMATWRTYCKRKGKTADTDSLKAMTDEEWTEIYKTLYWDKMKGDHINSQAVANLLVDFLWHSGTLAIRHLQRLVGVKDDGIVGPRTLTAINNEGALTLFWKLHKDRRDFLQRKAQKSPSQRVFLGGWMNRMDAIQFDKLEIKTK